VRLSEWSEQQVPAHGPQAWAREMIVGAIGGLNTGEDPVVFTTFAGGKAGQALAKLTAFAALTGGMLMATMTTDPTDSVDARLELVIVPWATVASSLRLEIAGDPEARLPVVVTVGEHTLEARYDQRAFVIAFFLEASRQASG
jgi:hypothetical protein